MKEKEIKNWKIKVENERITLSMTKKGADGLYHSASAPYPMCETIYNENGTKTIKRMTKKQMEKFLLKQLGYAV